jgi:4-amino-4-deoxy-L-arabinose transferase-like glycosyltransferase
MKNGLCFHQRPVLSKMWKHRCKIALGLIAALSFFLNFWGIGKVGYGNAYYAAAVRSMTQSFSNFFFVSFDPAGLVSVDKPPLGLWVQVLFVKVLGYHGWAMLLPQALAGTGSCLLLYALVARHFGRPAGLIAALTFALTPAAVVASRNNTMDMELVLVLLAATWFLFRSIETGKKRWAFTAALFVGLGFNVKMLQAYLILPAVAVVYLLFAPGKVSRRVLTAVGCLGIIAAVSVSWALAVDLYPKDSRPYVGSSSNNTVWQLIIGHNGAERIGNASLAGGAGGKRGGGFGGMGMPADGRSGNQTGGRNAGGPPSQGGRPGRDGGQNTDSQNSRGVPGYGSRNPRGQQAQGQMDGGIGRGFQGGAAGNDIGTAGALRLWSQSMYGQASWMIVFALFCIAVEFRKSRLRQRSVRGAMTTYWFLWLATMVLFFSYASFFHRYYLCMLAPGAAGLVGIGFSSLFRAFRERDGWRQWLFPASIAATCGVEIAYVWQYAQLRVWLVPLIAAACAVSLAGMAVYRFGCRRIALTAAVGCAVLALLSAPFYWCMTAVWYVPENITMPYAGPELASTTQTPGMTANQQAFAGEDSTTQALENYLVAHYKEGSYLVVGPSANDVDRFIVDTGLPAVAYGGFMGTDNALTLDRLKELIKAGKVTYFLIPSSGGMGGGNSELASYAEENATLVPASEYGGSGSGQLYLFQS